jgi:AcrR family transcriptional regulator
VNKSSNDLIQEQLIEARRNQILDAAAGVFAEKGFHQTTIRDIAKAAGIADGTIYNYFENKTGLLFSLFERMRAEVLEGEDLSQLTGADFKELLTAYFRYPLQAFDADNLSLFRVVMSEILINQELRTQYFHDVVQPTIEMGEQSMQQWASEQGMDVARTQLVLHIISGLMMGLAMQRVMGDEILTTTWDALPEILADLLLNGLQGDAQ